jgi:hypothetical protein
MKTVGGLRKLRHRARGRVNWQFLLAAAAYNLVRMRTLEATGDARRPFERRARLPQRRPPLESSTEVVMNARISASC